MASVYRLVLSRSVDTTMGRATSSLYLWERRHSSQEDHVRYPPSRTEEPRRAFQSQVRSSPVRVDGTCACDVDWAGYRIGGFRVTVERTSAWEEAKQKILPILWKNPVTGELHFQVHPCGAAELLIEPAPEGKSKEGALYPDGAHLTDLKEVRGLLYKMQRPAIAPNVGDLYSGIGQSSDDIDSLFIRTIGKRRIWLYSIIAVCCIPLWVLRSQSGQGVPPV